MAEISTFFVSINIDLSTFIKINNPDPFVHTQPAKKGSRGLFHPETVTLFPESIGIKYKTLIYNRATRSFQKIWE